jgi:hypothetical protein
LRCLNEEVTTMPRTTDTSRDLLFGLLALQNGLINQAQLMTAFHAWTQAKDRPMADILAEQGALDTPCLTLLEGLVIEHLRRHGNDPERSLAAIGIGRSTRDCLAQIANPELEASLAHVRSGSTEQDHDTDPDRTASYVVGAATSDGQRFRVLRPHARGGLGAVFVALDAELHREVALKQILDDHADEADSRQRFLREAEETLGRPGGKVGRPGDRDGAGPDIKAPTESVATGAASQTGAAQGLVEVEGAVQDRGARLAAVGGFHRDGPAESIAPVATLAPGSADRLVPREPGVDEGKARMAQIVDTATLGVRSRGTEAASAPDRLIVADRTVEERQ